MGSAGRLITGWQLTSNCGWEWQQGAAARWSPFPSEEVLLPSWSTLRSTWYQPNILCCCRQPLTNNPHTINNHWKSPSTAPIMPIPMCKGTILWCGCDPLTNQPGCQIKTNKQLLVECGRVSAVFCRHWCTTYGVYHCIDLNSSLLINNDTKRRLIAKWQHNWFHKSKPANHMIPVILFFWFRIVGGGRYCW